jgi:1-deoxy-D-xylulose-5-phosphate synthase
VLWDTGHQSYVHKLVTGRADRFETLRKKDGLSGYPSRGESEHDLVENSHASTALSYADGLAKAYRLRGEHRHVVAVVGDGALTGGMCWEALNNIASTSLPVVIVVNDNGRSYSPTIGGLADHLASLRMTQGYERALDTVKTTLSRTPLVGTPVYTALHGLKRGLKDFLQPQVLFEDLGLKYYGPIDGHDIAAMEAALRRAKAFGGPVIVHAVTVKGYGYQPAVDDEADCLHSVAPGHRPADGKPINASARGWTSVLGEEMVAIGAERADVVAITAAMLQPVGLLRFSEAYPDRTFDVGIAEQHAVTSAAGLAMGGMHPVVCLYATFLNRAFDQALMDVALHRLPVTFVLDRAASPARTARATTACGTCRCCSSVPGLRLAAPRDAGTLREELREALAVDDGPTAVRFPKGGVGDDVPGRRADRHRRRAARAAATTCWSWPSARWPGSGSRSPTAPPRRASASPSSTRAGSRRFRPSSSSWPGRTAGAHRRGQRAAPAGSARWSARRCATPASTCRRATSGIPQRFLDHASRAQILSEIGLTAQDVARTVVETIARLDGAESARSRPSEGRTVVGRGLASAPCRSWPPIATLVVATVALFVGLRTIRQRDLADRRDQWWKRFVWATELTLATRATRALGLRRPRAAGRSRLAGREELELLDAG